MVFFADGTGKSSKGGTFKWVIIGRTLYTGDPEEGADRFELPVKDGKLKGSNSIGDGITLTKKG